MDHEEKNELTWQDRYALEFAKGFRIGFIQASRRAVIACVKKFGKPNKRLIHKINHEVDCRILDKILSLLLAQSVSIETLEGMYDDIVPSQEELGENPNGED